MQSKQITRVSALALCLLSTPVQAVDGRCLALPAWWKTAGQEAKYRGPPRDIFTKNTIRVIGRGISWNGVVVSKIRLDQLLLSAKKLDPRPLLVLDVSKTGDCLFARSVREEMDRQYCKDGGCALAIPQSGDFHLR